MSFKSAIFSPSFVKVFTVYIIRHIWTKLVTTIKKVGGGGGGRESAPLPGLLLSAITLPVYFKYLIRPLILF